MVSYTLSKQGRLTFFSITEMSNSLRNRLNSKKKIVYLAQILLGLPYDQKPFCVIGSIIKAFIQF